MLFLPGVVLCGDAPRFLREPPQNAVFTNSSGLSIDCLGEGAPSPRVSWAKQDGRPLEEVSKTDYLGRDYLYFFVGKSKKIDI